jgi:hypothetical protein
VEIAADGSAGAWGLGVHREIYRFDRTKRAFDRVPGSLAQIAVGHDGTTWGLNGRGEIYRYDDHASRFVPIAGRLKRIVVGRLTVWGLN